MQLEMKTLTRLGYIQTSQEVYSLVIFGIVDYTSQVHFSSVNGINLVTNTIKPLT